MFMLFENLVWICGVRDAKSCVQFAKEEFKRKIKIKANKKEEVVIICQKGILQ